MPKKKEQSYTVVRGCNAPDKDGKEQRWEIGDTLKASDVSPEDLKALITMGAVEEK